MLSELACRRASPRDVAYKITDGHGLHLLVLPSGYRSWRWRYRFGGKEKLLTFGAYPEISRARARQLREDASRALREGIDPSVRKRQRVAAQVAETQTTFELIARDWHRSQLPVWSERYASTILHSFVNDVFPKIGKLPVRR